MYRLARQKKSQTIWIDRESPVSKMASIFMGYVLASAFLGYAWRKDRETMWKFTPFLIAFGFIEVLSCISVATAFQWTISPKDLLDGMTFRMSGLTGMGLGLIVTGAAIQLAAWVGRSRRRG